MTLCLPFTLVRWEVAFIGIRAHIAVSPTWGHEHCTISSEFRADFYSFRASSRSLCVIIIMLPFGGLINAPKQTGWHFSQNTENSLNEVRMKVILDAGHCDFSPRFLRSRLEFGRCLQLYSCSVLSLILAFVYTLENRTQRILWAVPWCKVIVDEA